MNYFKTLFLMMGLPVFISCGFDSFSRHDLASEQLYVTSVTPTTDDVVDSLSEVVLTFSQPFIVGTVTSSTIFIVAKTDYDTYASDEWDDLQDDVVDGSIAVLATDLRVGDDVQSVAITLNEEPLSGTEYVVVALPKIQSQDYFPLNQIFGGSLDTFFASRFSVSGIDAKSDPSGTMATTGIAADESDSDATSTNDDGTSTASYPTVATGATESSEETSSVDAETISDPGSETDTSDADIASFDWARVLITEVVTDPQQDHSESSVGNGIKFDSVVGTGTVSSADEYIEIFNGTEASVDLSLWSLNMLDGTDVSQDLSGAKEGFFSAGGSLSDVGPGEFLVLGNPTGAINNSITIELLNGTDDVIDSVIIDDANASSIENEAYFLNEEGEFLQGTATLGYFE